MNFSVKRLLCLVLPVVIALISVFALARPMSSPEFHKDTIQYLEDRRTVVLELTGASTAASVAITLIPGDVGTPIAEKLADLSSAFLVIMSALVLEKYLVTLTGFVVFNFLIPVVCVLLLLFFLLNREAYLHGAMRLLAFSLALFLLVPVSVRLSMFIENTYQDLQVAVSSALEQDQSDLYVEDASASVSESPAAEESPVAPPVQTPAEESQAWWQKALNGLTGRAEEAGSAVQEQIDKIKEDIAGIAQEVTVAPEKLSRLLNHYIEVVSVLIVTSCVIPVLVFLAFYALVKMLFNLDASPLAGLVRERFQK
jgi:hypothetical protein